MSETKDVVTAVLADIGRDFVAVEAPPSPKLPDNR